MHAHRIVPTKISLEFNRRKENKIYFSLIMDFNRKKNNQNTQFFTFEIIL